MHVDHGGVCGKGVQAGGCDLKNRKEHQEDEGQQPMTRRVARRERRSIQEDGILTFSEGLSKKKGTALHFFKKHDSIGG